MTERQKRGGFRANLTLRVALEREGGGPWLHVRDGDVPTALNPPAKALEAARRHLTADASREVNLSTEGLGLVLPAGSDVLPHDRLTILLALGPDRRPLDVVAALPARVVRAREILDGLEVGLDFDANEPAIDRRLAALIQARERRGRK